MAKAGQYGNMPDAKAQRNLVVWEEVAAELKANPATALLLDIFMDTPRLLSLSASVNQGQVKVLRELGGVIYASARNSRRWDGGRRRGDLWLRWEPDEDPSTRYSPRFL